MRRNKPLSEDVSLVQLANRTPGFSGADLANLLNEAAILATRYTKKQVLRNNEVNRSCIDRIIGGIAGTPLEDSKKQTFNCISRSWSCYYWFSFKIS